MRTIPLLIILAVALLLPVCAQPAQATTLPDLGIAVAAATYQAGLFVKDLITDAEAGGPLLVYGREAVPVKALALQKGLGSYRGQPFLFNGGVTTEPPVKNKPTIGIGTKIGSWQKARLNGYVQFTDRHLSLAKIPAPFFRGGEIGVCGSIGLLVEF